MAAVNCWEFKKCGREAGGLRSSELGVCPAPITVQVDGVNGGANGGRACWIVAGTLCGGKVQGTFAAKAANCLGCEFYLTVAREEGIHLAAAREVLARLRAAR
jgi:hypothetical protein